MFIIVLNNVCLVLILLEVIVLLHRHKPSGSFIGLDQETLILTWLANYGKIQANTKRNSKISFPFSQSWKYAIAVACFLLTLILGLRKSCLGWLALVVRYSEGALMQGTVEITAL